MYMHDMRIYIYICIYLYNYIHTNNTNIAANSRIYESGSEGLTCLPDAARKNAARRTTDGIFPLPCGVALKADVS